MHRLLQGDVGAGKTVVAVGALLVAVQGGHQGALMAPTEVLAEQHFQAVRDLLADLVVPDPGRLEGRRPLAVALLTNRTTAAERARLHEGLRSAGGRHRRRHPRAAHRGGPVLEPRRGGDRRAASLRRRAARRPAGQGPRRGERRGRRSRPPRHDGDADPPDRRHGRVRRPRHHRARRAAGGTGPGDDHVGPGRPRRGGGVAARARRGGARDTGPTWCARSWRAPSASRRARPPRRKSAWRSRCWPDCVSACCTAR